MIFIQKKLLVGQWQVHMRAELVEDASDYEAAYNEWLPLAEAGDLDASIGMGNLYKHGIGLIKIQSHNSSNYSFFP